jgi:DNA-binding transcriptional regulator PaaX
MAKRKITAEGMLRLLNDLDEAFFPMTRKQAWRNVFYPKIKSLEDYFPSEVKRSGGVLVRKGLVDIEKDDNGWVVKINEKGRKEVLKYKLDEFKCRGGPWDGKWRMVFYDVAELNRRRRDKLRYYLRKLGLYQMQESVWVGPYDVTGEVKYVREVLGVPHGVKMGVLEQLENEEDLKEIFNI